MAKLIQVAGENPIFIGRISSVAAAGINPLRFERRLVLHFPFKPAPPPRLSISCKLNTFDLTYIPDPNCRPRKSNRDDLEGLIIKRLREIVKPAVIMAVVLGLMISVRRNTALALTGGFISGGGTTSSHSSGGGTTSSDSYSSYSSFTSSSCSSCTCRSCSMEQVKYTLLGAVGVIPLSILFNIVNMVTGGSSEKFPTRIIIKLQVAALDPGRKLQADINRIAENADASTKTGRHAIVQKIIKSLFQHFDGCVAVDSYVKSIGILETEDTYDLVSLKERKKFDKVTLVNIDGGIKKVAPIKQTNSPDNEYTVVTILLRTEEVYSFPTIKNKQGLRDALTKLQEIPPECIGKLQIFWAPQQETDSLLHEELEKRFPDLRRLNDETVWTRMKNKLLAGLAN